MQPDITAKNIRAIKLLTTGFPKNSDSKDLRVFWKTNIYEFQIITLLIKKLLSLFRKAFCPICLGALQILFYLKK